MDTLQGLTIVEHATEIAGPYCAKLFADAGADVIKVEPAAGDPLRRHGSGRKPDEDGALFKFLNAGKRSVVLSPDDPTFEALLRGADILVTSSDLGPLDHASIARRFPQLVVVALSPYGTTGPYRDRPATPFTVEADSGAMSTRGRLDQPPIQVGGRVFEWLMGTYVAAASLAAVRRARATGQGDVIDCSLLEVCHIGGSGVLELLHQLAGRPPITGPARIVELPSIEPTADGWVGVNTNTFQQFESFLVMIGRSDLLEQDPSWAQQTVRSERMDEWNEIVRAWTKHHPTAEIVEFATLLRIPVAQVSNGQTVLDHPHFAARDIWEEAPDGTFTAPRPPYKIDGERPRPRGGAPKLGEHQSSVQQAIAAPVGDEPRQRRASDLPLTGLKVVDATAWWAGPSSTHILGALGADVVHVESIQRLDGARMVAGDPSLPSWWERSPMFLRSNTNKRDVTIDFSAPRGREVFLQLVEWADVVVENFSPRVFDNFGLTWEALSAINPRLVMVRMPAFGLDGPWRDNVGFAQTMEQVTGMAWVTGHEDDQPRIPRGPCDPLAGMNAVFATMIALQRRDQTGRGSLVEVAMVESALNAAAEQVIEYTAYGTVLGRSGNRSRFAAPQNLYGCRGDDNWLALSIATDEQWSALKVVLGNPAWTDDPSLDTDAGRHRAHDLIDEHLQRWAADRDLGETVEVLAARGIPAAPVWDVRLVPAHPQLQARGFFEPVEHPVVGTHEVFGAPYRFATIDRWNRTRAPLLGEHNDEVLVGELGLDRPTVDELAASKVIGTRPVGID